MQFPERNDAPHAPVTSSKASAALALSDDVRALVDRINNLKKEKNAVILAHNYMSPEIFHEVADLKGDSLGLARMAIDVEADTIIMAGVHFMAETAKILNPSKRVLIPDAEAGCSLAESITGAEVRALKEKYPGVPVVTYVNTTAEVKAETDICCTSGNAIQVVESLNVDRVIFLPDQYLGQWVASQTNVDVILGTGDCEVHKYFQPSELVALRKKHEGIRIVAHPECPQDVLAEADFTGSTSAMINYVKEAKAEKIMLITECSMSDNVAKEAPETDFIRPCRYCRHMQKITLKGILASLGEGTHEVHVPDDIARRARVSVERMLEVS
ncbi:MAG: quinolinate synthase NadA [Deltaproteobacteria bacterium]|nr:quinolinate synthase NadA [Deltaproteobacteria bacterium]